MKIKKLAAGAIASAVLAAGAVSAFAANTSYSDVNSGAWYAEAVNMATKHDLMVGTGKNKFSPEMSMNRAMVVQVLYNQAGQPAVSGKAAFTDVKRSDWYYNAVQWAAQNNVAAGVGDGKFNPNGSVTRQEFAQFLYNNNNGKPSVTGSLGQFPDSNKVSDWAKAAMIWANQNGIINGSKSGNQILLNPTGNATRAEAASMLVNFLDISDPGHDYKEEVTTPATCAVEGTKTLTCSICGKQKIETTPTTEHTVVTDKAVEPTCTEAGLTEGSHCSVCKEVIKEQEVIPAIGHEYKRTVVKDPTCSTEGQAKYTCANCGDSYTETIPATEQHQYTSKVTKEATCTDEGEKTYTCSVCGKSYKETIPATGHDYESKVTTPATNTSNGVMTYTCKNCGDIYTEVIPATGHVYEKTITKAATCTEDGLATFQCTLCNDSYTEVIPATGHDYESVTTDATCDEDGQIKYTCKNCGDTYSTVIPKLGHDWLEETADVWVVDQEAYDEEVITGYRPYYMCTGCEERFYFDEYPASDKDTGNYPGQNRAGVAVEDHLFVCPAERASYTLKKEAVWGTVHHDEVGHYETQVIGYKCSRCGEYKAMD